MSFFKNNNLFELNVNNLRLGKQYVSGDILTVSDNGVVIPSSSAGSPQILDQDGVISVNGVTFLDTSNTILNMTLPDAEEYTNKTIRLLYQRGNNAVITFSKGTITLTPSNDDYSRELVFYGDAWHVVNGTITSFYPTVQQGSKLVGDGGIGPSRQGESVSLSADGNTLAVGGSQDNEPNPGGIGATWVFTRVGGVWTQQGPKLVGTGNSGQSEQGQSVSLSADGNTLAVGGSADNGGIGATWIFTRSGGAWTQQGSKLVGGGNNGPSNQGYSVSLSADGNTLAVGGPNDNLNLGATWIFTRAGGVWIQQGLKLVGGGNIGLSQQGFSVSLSADGNTLVVGGPGDNGGIGAIWVFTRAGGAWTQQGLKLVGGGNNGSSRQGESVSLSADGNTLAVGGLSDNSFRGATWIFTRAGGVWAQQGPKLVGTGGSSVLMFQGNSVSLSADGNTLAVGGNVDNIITLFIGATWVFTRAEGTWTQQGSKLVGTGNNGSSRQGQSVSLSADGNTLAVGGNTDNSSLGATWIFI
jgi:hypothetical protein